MDYDNETSADVTDCCVLERVMFTPDKENGHFSDESRSFPPNDRNIIDGHLDGAGVRTTHLGEEEKALIPLVMADEQTKRDGGDEKKFSDCVGTRAKIKSVGGEKENNEISHTINEFIEEDGRDDKQDDHADETAREEEYDGVPVDRGWAWVVMAACFMMHFFVVGAVKSFGVFFMELKDTYDVTARDLSIAQGTSFTLLLGTGFVGNILAARFSTRLVVCVGGILSSLGFIFTAFIPSFKWIYLTYSVITGIGYAFSYSPFLVILGCHFRKHRSLANGVSVSGAGAGGFIIPNLFRFLLDEYGLQGSFLLMGALLLNVCACGLVLRPLKSYSKRKKRKKMCINREQREGDSMLHYIEEDFELIIKEPSRGADLDNDDKYTEVEGRNSTEHLQNGPERASSDNGLQREHKKNETFLSNNNVENNSDRKDVFLKVETVDMEKNHRHICSTHRSTWEKERQHECTAFENTILKEDTIKALSLPLFKSSSFKDSESESRDSRTAQRNRVTRKVLKCLGCAGTDRHSDGQSKPLFEWSLLKDPLFMIYALSIVITNLGYPNVFLMLPAHTEQLGHSRDRSALLISIVGLADMAGRAAFGWISDRNIFPRRFGFGGCMAITACLNLLLPVMTSFPALMTYVLLYGLFAGSYISLIATILADTMGTERLGSSIGLLHLITVTTLIAGPFICGSIKDITGSWDGAFLFAGAASLVASLLPLLEPCVVKYQSRKAQIKSS